jgi:MFS family permease
MTSAVAKPTAVGFAGVLRHREFRALWLADAQSSIGDQLSRIALAVLVFERSHSAFITALVYAVTFAPALVSGVLLGSLADRFPHRTTLVRANLIRAGLVATMAVGGVPIAALVALVVLSTLVSAPFDAANSALLADVLTEDEGYTVAASLRTITHQVAQLLGFAVGGVLLTVIAPRSALLIDAATFVVAAVLVRAAIQWRPAPLPEHEVDEPFLASMLAGTRLVARTPRLRVLLGLALLMGPLVVPEGLAAPYAASISAPTAGIGLLLAAGPAGTALGSFVFVKFIAEPRRVQLIGVLAAAAGLPLAACLTHPPLAASVVLWALSGVGCAYLAQLKPSYVISAPRERRGQVGGVAASSLMAVQGLGILLGGLAASATNPAAAVALAGAVTVGMGAWLSLRWREVLAAERPDPRPSTAVRPLIDQARGGEPNEAGQRALGLT